MHAQYPHQIRLDKYGTGRMALIISTAALFPGSWESMVMRPNGDELDCIRTTSEADARATHDQLLDRYRHAATAAVEASITPKMRALIAALTAAREAGAAAATGEDGGASNFDAPALLLPRWRQADVELCAERAGLRCFPWKIAGQRRYVFPVPSGAQGNDRTRQAEAMSASLTAAGYTSCVYYQLD